MKVIQDKEQEARREKTVLQTQIQDVRHQASSAEESVKTIEKRLQRLRSDIATQKGGGSSRDAQYGPQVAQIRAQAQKHPLLKDCINIGPIGMLVKIKDEMKMHEQCVEKALGMVAYSFVVDSHEKMHALIRIIQQNNAGSKHSVIYQARGARYNIHRKPNATSVLDALVIEDDYIFNAVINRTGIESVVLAKTDEEVVRNYLGSNGYLRDNIKSCILPDGTLIKYKGGNKGREPNYYAFRRVLASDMSAAIRQMEEEVANVEEELETARRGRPDVRQQESQLNASIRRAEDSLKQCSVDHRSTERKKSELQENLNEVQEAGRIDFTRHEEEATELRESIQNLQQQLTSTQEDSDACKKELSQLKTDKEEAERQKDTLNTLLQEFEKKLHKEIERHKTQKKQIERLKREVSSKSDAFENVKRHVEEKELARDEVVNQARNETSNLVKDWDGNPIKFEKNENKKSVGILIKALKTQLAECKFLILILLLVCILLLLDDRHNINLSNIFF